MTPLAQFRVEQLLLEAESLRVEVLSGGIVRLALARPEARNALDPGMTEALLRALETLASLDTKLVRLLLLDGEGEVFCAGADLSSMREMSEADPEETLEDARRMALLMRTLAGFPAPVVCVVRGAAIGGGLGLLACADIVVAESVCVFAMPEVRLGIVPAIISPYVIRRIGLANAAPLLLAGSRIGSEDALRIGLVNRLASPPESIEDALSGLLTECLAAAPEAARQTKSLLLKLSPLPDDHLSEITSTISAQARTSKEGLHGMRAFFDRIPPEWATL